MKKVITILIAFALMGLSAKAQNYQWITGGGGTDNMSVADWFERVDHICTDAHGNIYIAAMVGSTNLRVDTFFTNAVDNYPGRPNLILASYTCNNTLRWVKLIQAHEWAESGGIEYYNGSIYVTGSTVGANIRIGTDTVLPSSNLSSFTARFDTLGNYKWIRYIGLDNNQTAITAGDPGVLAIDGQGYIHNFNAIRKGCELSATDSITETGTFDFKYDSTGAFLSHVHVAQLDSLKTFVKCVYSPVNNKFYALIGPNVMFDTSSFLKNRVAAFNNHDSVVWIDSTTVYENSINGIDYKGGNALYICANSSCCPDTFSFGGMTVHNTFDSLGSSGVICRLDTNGVTQWIYKLDGNISIDYFEDLCILPNGNITATGFFGGIAKHNSDILYDTINASLEPWLVIVNPSGNTVFLDEFHGDGFYKEGRIMTCDAIGNIFVGGYMVDTMYATGIPAYHSNGGNTDFFVLKYGYDCSSLTSTNDIPLNNNTLAIYPNPTTNIINISLPNTNQKAIINLYNMMGQLIIDNEKLTIDSNKASTMSIVNYQLSIEKLSQGIYFLEVITDGERMVRKVVKMD